MKKEKIIKKTENVNTKKHAFALIFVVLAAFVVTAVGLMIAGETIGIGDILVEFSTVGAAFVAVLFAKKTYGQKLSDKVSFKGFDFSVPIMITLLDWALCELLDHFSAVVLSNFMTIEPNESEKVTVFAVIGAVIIAPIFEELIFRFSFMGYFKNSAGRKFTVIATSVIFALIHLYNIQGFLDVLLGALIMAYVYIKTENLLYTIAMHFLHNSMCFLPLKVYTVKNGFVFASTPYLIVCSVVAVIGIVYFVKHFKPKFIDKTSAVKLEIVPA
ncbi:type II CAAX endopeptidase family protein [Ruminococcus sp.]|uniref:CPBP family intramembrane glutamic endopeptidase n=1 Tax=Ruminococcus sp. TaxID=41978 RepID=UPI0025FE6476|nr:type II CAAX endopeptidase family protein [Ruminococcus sp.]MBQ8967963.1 CPBP family intramembrane metalloprotease [Ruminococcus sp.]